MVEERASPSAGWREVYDEMGVDDQHEASDETARERCPDCGLVVARKEEHRCPLAAIEQVDEVNEDVELHPTPGEGDD